MRDAKIVAITTGWPAGDSDLFARFRKLRNDSLKDGETILEVRTVHVTLNEYNARFFPEGHPHPAHGAKFVGPPGSAAPTFAVNLYGLKVGDKTLPAVETCRTYLRLLARFFRDPKVFGIPLDQDAFEAWA